jgi:putative membrane-bound dehydrogenase-like protein
MIQNLCRLLIAWALVTTSVQLVAQDKTPRNVALSPVESLARIEIEEGFEVKLIAHEPQVIDPVDAAFDDSGRLWVVEMRDYPYPTSDSPSGRVRILSDEDLDGQFEKSEVFADRLDMPTGLALWKDGAVITLAGQVVWFQDTDGDLKSDAQQVWIEGFAKENEQLRANHPRLGPDGWWYIASGLRGGNVIAGPDFRSPDDKPITLGSRDVRFNPQTKQLEAITGPAQFGLCFDSIGNRIFCSNRNPAVMVRFEQEDLVGNPLAGLIPSVVDLIPAGEQSQVFPLVNAWTTSNLHSGQFTAACGVFYHEFAGENSKQVPDDFRERVRLFACEPTGSLVHSTVFDGSLENPTNRDFRRVGTKLKQDEWLASRDEWFRPVNIAQAPDGGLLIVDMHRAVIEHPAWVPDELKKRPDERWGNDCGRIFHVALKNKGAVDAIPDLRSKPLHLQASGHLVAYLSCNNAWLRDVARRLLIERNATDQFESILKIVSDQRSETAGRIAALQLASVLANGSVDLTRQLSELVSKLIEQSDVPAFRTALYRLAKEQFSTDSKIIGKIVESGAQTGGFSETMECLRCLAASQKRPQGSELALATRIQVHLPKFAEVTGLLGEMLVYSASAFKDRPEVVLSALLDAIAAFPDSFSKNEIYPVAVGRLTVAVLDRPQESLAGILDRARHMLASDQTSNQRAALAVLTEITNRASKLPDSELDVASAALWDDIRALAANESVEVGLRVGAIAMLPKSTRTADLQLLPKFARSSDLQLKSAAVRAWASAANAECDEYLLGELVSSSPQLQQVLLELIGQKPERLDALAEQLAAGKITAKRIGSNELKKLVSRAKGETQTKLNAALESIVNSDRAKVVTSYQASLTLAADALRGKEVFVKHCASCHKVADVGVQVGPDISDSRTQQPAQILTNILDPNRAIDNNYFRFVALTAEDQVIEGMIAEETSDAIVLRGQNNVRTTLKRADLQELKATGVSLMPEGLESQIDPQAMADLISFIKNWRYLDGSIPK